MRLLLVGFAALVACGGSQIQTPTKSAAETTKHLPATLEAARPKEGEPRALHVRVYADEGIRALPRWKEDIADQIDYAGQLLQPMLGVRVTVDAVKDWNRAGDPKDALADLVKLDDGKDVVWVIGYVTPPDVASKAFSELGQAQILGHHVVVRGWAEKPETDALAALLPDLKQAERAETIAAYKRHKQTVVLLHLLAQTLGAIAEADPSWIQHPLYSHKQSTFSDRNRELMQIAIDQRLGAGTDQTIAHDLLEAIEKQEWGGWVPTDHDEVVKALRNVLDAAKLGKTAADVPPVAYEQFDRIRSLRAKGDTAEALSELDNLLTAYPANATMHLLKCEILLEGPPAAPAPPKGMRDAGKATPPPPPKAPAKAGVSDKARAACARVSELAPGDPGVHFVVGEALNKTGDVAGARTELKLAADKIKNLETGQADAWKRLAAIYQQMGALTWTDEVIAAGKLDGDPLAATVATTRARYGVPRGAKFVKPDGEHALVAAVRAALDLVYASKYPEATAAITAGEKKWPGAPGFLAARCDLELRQGAADSARGACNRALAIDPDDSWALYLSGVIALRDASGTRAGIDRLKHAIKVDPDLGQAWRALGKAYERTKDQAAHDALAADYQKKFGQALP